MKVKASHTGTGVHPTLESAFEGPFEITKVKDNGTVTIKKSVNRGARYETLNIRRIQPFHEREEEPA